MYSSTTSTENHKDQPDKEIAAQLIADGERPETFPWTEDYQQHLLGALVQCEGLLGEAAHLVRPDYFIDRAHELIAKVLLDYWQTYKQLPDKLILRNELEVKLKDSPALVYNLGELETCCSTVAPHMVNKEYLLAKLRDFALTQEVRKNIGRLVGKANKGATGEELRDYYRALVENLNVDSVSAPQGKSISQLFALREGFDWLIAGRLLRANLVLLPGRAKGGKTTWTQALLFDWLERGLAMGQEAVVAPVLYCDWENPLESSVPNFRLAMDGRQPDNIEEQFRYFNKHFPDHAKLPAVLTRAYLERLILPYRGRTGVIVIDTFRRAFLHSPDLPPAWENDSSIVAKLLTPVQEFCHESGWSVIMLHHTNKAGMANGTAEFQAGVDAIWTFERVLDHQNKETRNVRIKIEGRTPYIPPLRWSFDDGRYNYLGQERDAEEQRKAAEKLEGIGKVLALLGTGDSLSAEAIIDRVQAAYPENPPGKVRMRGWLKELTDNQCIHTKHKQGYWLCPDWKEQYARVKANLTQSTISEAD